MDKKLLDIYSDYLVAQNYHATATGLSDLLDGQISHDKITRFLNLQKEAYTIMQTKMKSYLGIILMPKIGV